MITIETFAEIIKAKMEEVYDNEYKININNVTKNNGLHLTGITISNINSNIAPNIYLDGYYADYKNGRTIENICNEIVQVYENNKASNDFPIGQITDFENIKDKICFKLVNREKNAELLANIPYIEYQDLAIIFYILISKDNIGTVSITVKNTLLKMWGVDTDILYDLAKKNTQKLLSIEVQPITKIMAEIINDSANTLLNEEIAEECDALNKVHEDGTVPMYVATNSKKVNGACVILYDGILKDFAEKVGDDFYILPSSVHEVILVPINEYMDDRYLAYMVKEVNATEISPDEILSDNIYMYHADENRLEIVELEE